MSSQDTDTDKNINNKNDNNNNNITNTTTNTDDAPKPRKRFAIPSISQVYKKSEISTAELNAKLRKAEEEEEEAKKKAAATIITTTTTTTTSISQQSSSPLPTPTYSQQFKTSPTNKIPPPPFLFKTPSPNRSFVNSTSPSSPTSPTSPTNVSSSSPSQYYSPTFVKNPTAPAPPQPQSFKPPPPPIPGIHNKSTTTSTTSTTIIGPSIPNFKPSNFNNSSGSSGSSNSNSNYIIYCNINQKGNPMIRNFSNKIKIEYRETQYPDYVINSNCCAFYLSLKVHRDNPKYIIKHIQDMPMTSTTSTTTTSTSNSYILRILIVLIDLTDSENCDVYLDELNIISIKLQCTLIVSWSHLESAKYLEAYKTFYDRQPDTIKTKPQSIEQGGKSKNEEVLTSIKSINKTDATTLIKNFNNMKQIFGSSKDTISKCPGFGPIKVQNFYNTIHQPFKKSSSSSSSSNKRKTTTTTTTTTHNNNDNYNNNIINNINSNNEDNNQNDIDPLDFSFDYGDIINNEDHDQEEENENDE